MALDLRTEGRGLVFHLRVDGTNLEPWAGSCRRWLLRRVAREGGSAGQAFCRDDSVLFDAAAGVRHTLELAIGSEHTVATRVMLRPGDNLRWRMPIQTGRIEVPLELEPGHSYTLEGREAWLDLRPALAEEAPTGTRWDPEAHEPVFRSGVEVGSLRLRILRDADGHVVEEISAPLRSGRLRCEPPFCPGGSPQIGGAADPPSE